MVWRGGVQGVSPSPSPAYGRSSTSLARGPSRVHGPDTRAAMAVPRECRAAERRCSGGVRRGQRPAASQKCGGAPDAAAVGRARGGGRRRLGFMGGDGGGAHCGGRRDDTGPRVTRDTPPPPPPHGSRVTPPRPHPPPPAPRPPAAPLVRAGGGPPFGPGSGGSLPKTFVALRHRRTEPWAPPREQQDPVVWQKLQQEKRLEKEKEKVCAPSGAVLPGRPRGSMWFVCLRDCPHGPP